LAVAVLSGHAGAATVTKTFTVVADSYVKQDKASTNFGG
jgi:hypothetical protein